MDLNSAGVLHSKVLLRSTREKLKYCLNKICLIYQSLTWRMCVCVIIWTPPKACLPHSVFLPICATNFSQNIHLTVLMMTETPQSQGWWPERPSKPVCHYCWPMAHFYPPAISRPPWEEAAASREGEGEGAKGEWEAEIERRGKQGWRVVGEVRGQQRALGEPGEEKR